ncbi:MAG: formate dehydrogenase subunit alpha [Marinilabiliaceae bacterium]|jgi:formate dehydrogenase alpha subunit|nr:formate dehydrogenase subunit alpha [Marinilabiliaceae bacterium]
MVNLTIDGIVVKAEEGKTVLEAALENGIYIPNLCHHPDLVPSGNCRMCLVEIEGRRGEVISCTTPVEEGMLVKTDSDNISHIRQTTLEMIHANHTQDCTSCSKNSVCGLQEVTAYVGVNEKRLASLRKTREYYEPDDSNPFFTLDHNKCIMCGICVRACDEVAGVNALDYGYRGFDTIITSGYKQNILESVCESCGECVVRCPVGALQLKETRVPNREVKTVCTYCGVGCNIYLGVRANTIVSSRGDRESIVNKGRLCVKGRFGYEFVNHPERLKYPLIKKNGEFERVSWDEALDLVAEKFSKSKGSSFAALTSAKATNEDNYVIQKFTRAVMGTNNIDHCARLCHAPTVSGLVQSFGSGAMTNSIDEFKEVKTLFSIGSNTTAAHPIIGLHIKEAKRNGGRIIVANPKEIDLCRFADIYMQHYPGTDVVLLMGMMKVIVDEGLQDEDFIRLRTEGYIEFMESLNEFDLETTERITGVPRQKVIDAARMYATNTPSSIVYAMGITQHSHGTDNVLAVSNLALLTGNIGKASSGVNPLRGQNNVQGACDMGGLPNVYPGYQNVGLPEIKAKFEKAWKADLDPEAGLTHTEMFTEIERGNIKSLYQVGENPILSEADSNHVKKSLDKLDFFVVQDIFLTETARYADVILPAASFAEKNGTFTNTERRVQRVRKAVEPAGEAKDDWWIAAEIAKRMGAGGFEYESASQIMDEIAEVTPIYGGISFDRIEYEGLQWPCPNKDHQGTKFLHTNRFSRKSGLGKLFPLTYKASVELPDKDYPLLLTTDRSLYHYHTSTMTRRVEGLEKIEGEERLLINLVDAEKMGISDGEMVSVKSRRGNVKVKIKVTHIVPPGVASLTFHFHETPTNELTICAVDPIAKIPETKVCSVKVEKL